MALVANQELKEEYECNKSICRQKDHSKMIEIFIDHMLDEEEEEEEEFFEIDLELVNNISTPHYNWENYFTATTRSNCTLLANCLLPIADVSSAIPTTRKACDAFISWTPGGDFRYLRF
ncbi:hypothetical protein P3S68_029856 [Capsicum galapagoense]